MSGRLTETHEYFHRQLDDTTAFGSLTATIAALADACPTGRWPALRADLQAMSDLVHESFAVGMSLLTTQREVAPIAEYPMYDRHVRTVQRLVGLDVHPWVALIALRAAAMACMQSSAVSGASEAGLVEFVASSVPKMERPNHRLAELLRGSYSDAVAREHRRAVGEHGGKQWWQPGNGVRLSPESMDGDAADASALVHQRLLCDAERIIAAAGGTVVPPDGHHDRLRELLTQARVIVPDGLVRIGALVEAANHDLLHGGPLDGQTIDLTMAPHRAVVLPYGSVSGVSGEGAQQHVFVVVTTPRRVRSAHRLEGILLPSSEAFAALRTTVFDGDVRDAVLLLVVDRPADLQESAPVYVSVLSSAAAADGDAGTAWMRAVDPDHVSLVMDTPATAALHRWCADGARFHTDTRMVRVEAEEVRVIVGRLEEPGRRSPLVVIPSTEFGARWFEAARVEDPLLHAAVVDDPELFEREAGHLDIVLNHLLFEERFLGTGSWRR